MDPADGRKDMFVKYLDIVRPTMYHSILESNGELLATLYKKKLSENLEGSPLWLLTGGELINMYSTASNKVATKDIDCKLYFTGDFSIPYSQWKQAIGSIPSFSLSSFDFYDEDATRTKANALLKTCAKHLSANKGGSIDAYKTWSIGESQKVKMCASQVVNTLKGTYTHLNLTNGKRRGGIELATMEGCKSQPWINGDKCKAFIVNVPYVTQVGRDNVPYDINDKVLDSLGARYDEDIDGHHIDSSFVEEFDKKVQSWIQDPRLKTPAQKRAYLERQLKVIRIKNQRFKLSTVVGVVLVYNEDRGEWYLFQEGLLDLYIDYSAGHHSNLEKHYLGRYQDGSFPSVVKPVKYRSRSSQKMGVMKFPTMTWLLYDQLRMLYVTLRGEYLGCDDKECKWVPLGGGAAGNHGKYFKKLQGMITSFGSVIGALQESDADIETISTMLRKCKSKNIELCGPNMFLGNLFDTFQSEALASLTKPPQSGKDKRASSKKTKHTRGIRHKKKQTAHKRGRSSKRKAKRKAMTLQAKLEMQEKGSLV